MDRRAFLGLTVAVPAVVVAERHYKRTTLSEAELVKLTTQVMDRAPYDTDDECWDEWLSKDEMHL
jgi:hypothetical protein